MDLLLHLVDQKEVDIEKVDLREICNQYLEIINQVAELDLDRAGEYLVIAATLAAKKSEALLPGSPVSEDGMPLGDQFDPRFFSELRERLKAYRATKLRAEKLRAVPQLGLDVFAGKRQTVEEESEEEFPEIAGEGLSLGKIFFALLKRVGEAGRTFRIRLEPITVVKFMVEMVDRLNGLKGRTGRFIDLVRGMSEKASPRAKITGTFVATLELMKRGIVTADEAEGGYLISYRDGGRNEFASEFDQNGSDKIINLAAYRNTPASEEAVEPAMKEAV
jgi:segregation and condensation protein A